MPIGQKHIEHLGMEDMYSSKPGAEGDYVRIRADRDAARKRARELHDEQIRIMLKAFE